MKKRFRIFSNPTKRFAYIMSHRLWLINIFLLSATNSILTVRKEELENRNNVVLLLVQHYLPQDFWLFEDNFFLEENFTYLDFSIGPLGHRRPFELSNFLINPYLAHIMNYISLIKGVADTVLRADTVYRGI